VCHDVLQKHTAKNHPNRVLNLTISTQITKQQNYLGPVEAIFLVTVCEDYLLSFSSFFERKSSLKASISITGKKTRQMLPQALINLVNSITMPQKFL